MELSRQSVHNNELERALGCHSHIEDLIRKGRQGLAALFDIVHAGRGDQHSSARVDWHRDVMLETIFAREPRGADHTEGRRASATGPRDIADVRSRTKNERRRGYVAEIDSNTNHTLFKKHKFSHQHIHITCTLNE